MKIEKMLFIAFYRREAGERHGSWPTNNKKIQGHCRVGGKHCNIEERTKRYLGGRCTQFSSLQWRKPYNLKVFLKPHSHLNGFYWGHQCSWTLTPGNSTAGLHFAALRTHPRLVQFLVKKFNLIWSQKFDSFILLSRLHQTIWSVRRCWKFIDHEFLIYWPVKNYNFDHRTSEVRGGTIMANFLYLRSSNTIDRLQRTNKTILYLYKLYFEPCR